MGCFRWIYRHFKWRSCESLFLFFPRFHYMGSGWVDHLHKMYNIVHTLLVALRAFKGVVAHTCTSRKIQRIYSVESWDKAGHASCHSSLGLNGISQRNLNLFVGHNHLWVLFHPCHMEFLTILGIMSLKELSPTWRKFGIPNSWPPRLDGIHSVPGVLNGFQIQNIQKWKASSQKGTRLVPQANKSNGQNI